ncbi:hypothetical protein H9P43_003016 [Blastocladiella emersonii ATCC 22665]|nr:hypothetical protein H9P43_003016 [Blastocladiella emersonii ATCC 22665]
MHLFFWRRPAEPLMIHVRLRRPQQLFNTFDPAPYYEQDLDPAAAQYILDTAREAPSVPSYVIELHVPSKDMYDYSPHGFETTMENMEEAIHAYFERLDRECTQRLRRELQVQQTCLLIGLLFLTLCLFVAAILQSVSLWATLGGNLLTIAGWVSVWKPADFFLFGWWMIVNERGTYRKLAKSTVLAVIRNPTRAADKPGLRSNASLSVL